MNSKSLFLILGNHLFPIDQLDKYKKMNFFMAEDKYLCSYEKHHKLKIAFFLTSMRNYADNLNKNNFKLEYIKMNSSSINLSYEEKLINILNKKKINHLFSYEIEDKFFEKKIIDFTNKINLNYTIIQSPMFLNSRLEFKNYLLKSKKPLMGNFYKIQRLKNNILVESNGSPVGGKWSFDLENRKKIPKNLKLPEIPKTKNNKNLINVKNLISKYFNDHPGTTDYFWLASDRGEVKKLLKNFIKDRLNFFGDYEDAVTKNNIFLFHSFLSPYLNNGLITPKEVLDILLPDNTKIYQNLSLNNLEGFVRQLIGWREFIRGIYQNYSSKLESTNFFSHKRKLSKDWYNGTTGIDPIDDAIKGISKYGYAHHIIRLMHLCNIMNLSEIHPSEIYKWFMEMFVDSSDWVMSPNVFGMGTYSDGGIFSTKPYVCGSNYIIKMSDYKKGDWSEIVDGLYWNFISKNMHLFDKNPRMGMIKLSLNKMDHAKLIKHQKIAKKFIIEKTKS